MKKIVVFILFSILITACAGATPAPSPTPVVQVQETSTVIVTTTPPPATTATPQNTETPTLSPTLEVFVQQPKGKIDFSANNAMVLDVKEQAPLHGSLDLNGLPW